MFTFQFDDATDEQKWEQIRNWRNNELAATDWTQVADAPVNKTTWAEYRQELRDLPDTKSKPDNVQIPTRPAQ